MAWGQLRFIETNTLSSVGHQPSFYAYKVQRDKYREDSIENTNTTTVTNTNIETNTFSSIGFRPNVYAYKIQKKNK